MRLPCATFLLATLVARVSLAEVVVFLPETAPDLVAQAGKELRKYLSQMTDETPSDGVRLRVSLCVEPVLRKRLGLEGFHLKSDGRTATLTGSTPLAAQHAACAFLEKLGCRWFFPGETWEVIPKLKKLALPVLDEESRPDYQMRRIWYGWGIGPIPENAVAYRDWVRRNRMGGSLTGSTGHAYARIARGDLHFKSHPEWFPLLDGKRHRGGQLCIGNPAIRTRAIERANSRFETRPDLVMYSMSPNDGAGWCQCARCATLGSVTDQALWLANQVAYAIRDEHPDKLVAMYGYAGTSTPPNIEAAPNVIIFIATAFNRVGFRKSLEGWSQKCSLIGIRDYYNVIIWNRDMPRWQVDRMRTNIPEHHRKGAIAVSAESGNEWAPEGLNYYVAAKLMWDTKTDVDRLLDDFFVKCWGRAAKPMRRYYERFRTDRMSNRTLAACLQDVAEASALASDPGVIRRLDMFKLYLHWVRLYYEHNSAPRGDEATAAVRRAMHFAWRIRKANLIHSYAQFRERRIWRIPRHIMAGEIERWKLTDKPPPVADTTEPDLRGPDALGEAAGDDEVAEITLDEKPKPKEPSEPPPMFTHEQIEAMFQDDLKAFEGVIQVEPREFSLDLVPLPQNTPGCKPPDKVGFPRHRSANSFLFRSRQAGTVDIRVHPGFVRRRSGTYRLYQIEAPENPIEEGNIEGSESYVLTVKTPRPGLYRIEFSLGGMAARVDFGEGHGVWELTRGRRAHVIGGSGWQYFFVPKGTRAFVLGLASPDGWAKVTMRGPEGKTHLQQAGNYAPGQEFPVVVPEGLDGAVWSFSVGRCEDATGIFLLGVPPYASVRPHRLLAPREVVPD